MLCGCKYPAATCCYCLVICLYTQRSPFAAGGPFSAMHAPAASTPQRWRVPSLLGTVCCALLCRTALANTKNECAEYGNMGGFIPRLLTGTGILQWPALMNATGGLQAAEKTPISLETRSVRARTTEMACVLGGKIVDTDGLFFAAIRIHSATVSEGTPRTIASNATLVTLRFVPDATA